MYLYNNQEKSIYTVFWTVSINNSDFFPTGDIGFIDISGNLHLIGRIKDIINVGGSKIDPTEVEKVLLDHDQIIDAVAYPLILENGEEKVQAAIVIKGNSIDTKELSRFCYCKLDDYKIPIIFHSLSKISRTPSGKCIRTELPDYPRQYLLG